MKLLSQLLGKRHWFSGEKLTYVDLSAYDIVDLHHRLEPKCLYEFTNLKDFLNRFEVLPMDPRLLFQAIRTVFTGLRTW
ncbi:glutathione S-transferase Mu 1-like [Bos taurus]|uniref:glutathione S-transferase Mu 1-like n=1 Tax=Bos taurus TaxID=9913 RepID=UPI0028CBA32B|nr:glutathione S-transferase Mu 1-like [Bos taurus]